MSDNQRWSTGIVIGLVVGVLAGVVVLDGNSSPELRYALPIGVATVVSFLVHRLLPDDSAHSTELAALQERVRELETVNGELRSQVERAERQAHAIRQDYLRSREGSAMASIVDAAIGLASLDPSSSTIAVDGEWEEAQAEAEQRLQLAVDRYLSEFESDG